MQDRGTAHRLLAFRAALAVSADGDPSRGFQKLELIFHGNREVDTIRRPPQASGCPEGNSNDCLNPVPGALSAVGHHFNPDNGDPGRRDGWQVAGIPIVDFPRDHPGRSGVGWLAPAVSNE
jgi:hypothetical protein